MKILFLAPQPFMVPRGTPIAIRAALEALSQLGHEVDVLTLPFGEDVVIPRVTIRRIGAIPLVAKIGIGPSIGKAAADLSMLRTARRMLSRERYDVVHGVEDGALIAWILSRLTGVPFVYDMDSVMSSQLRERSRLLAPVARVFGWLEGAALQNALAVLAVCPALAEVAARHQDPENVFLLPDMPLTEGEDVPPSREILAIPGKRIVYVGNLEPYQGVDLLLRGFRQIARDHPEARVIIVGGSRKPITRYRRAFADLVEAGQLHLLGPRPLGELGSILTAADILASPRLQGINTPMKIYSYLESGRPVLATDLLTHTQVLGQDVACLVPPTDEGMAEGLDRLLSDAEEREALGGRGREFVRREFGRVRFRERLHDFYRHVENRIGEGVTETEPTAH